ncbi:MAG: hypothetical protein ACTSPK_08905 [Candidatus Heimdallarchaeota archaeon]
MKIFKKITMGLVLLSFLMIPITNVNAAILWHTNDHENDVMYFDNGIYQYTGDYIDEIDISSVMLDGSSFFINLQGIPSGDFDHHYVAYINWAGYPFLKLIQYNYTTIEFGHGNNIVNTYIYYSGGGDAHETIIDGIDIVENSVRCPIASFSNLDNTTADTIYCAATYWENEPINSLYFDNLSGTATLDSFLFPGFTLIIPVISIIFVIAICNIHKKH